MTAKNINAIDLVSRALAGMRFAADVPTMPRGVIDYLAPFAHLTGDHDAVSFLVEAMQAEADGDWILVSERLPEHDTTYGPKISIDVEAKFADGHTEMPCWCNLADREWERYGHPLEFRTDVVAWRPMRGDHD